MRQHPQPAPPKREAGLLTDLLEALSVAAALRYHYNMGAKVPGKRVFHPQRLSREYLSAPELLRMLALPGRCLFIGLRGAETQRLDYGWSTADRGRRVNVNAVPDTYGQGYHLDVKMKTMTMVTARVLVLLLLIPRPLVVSQAAPEPGARGL